MTDYDMEEIKNTKINTKHSPAAIVFTAISFLCA